MRKYPELKSDFILYSEQVRGTEKEQKKVTISSQYELNNSNMHVLRFDDSKTN